MTRQVNEHTDKTHTHTHTHTDMHTQTNKQTNTHTHTNGKNGKWIRSCCSLRLRPQPDGWVPVHYTGAMGHAKQSPQAWPGTHKITHCDTNCGVGTRRPTRTPTANGLCRSRGPLPPQSMSRYSFILLSRERKLRMSFLPNEMMP